MINARKIFLCTLLFQFYSSIKRSLKPGFIALLALNGNSSIAAEENPLDIIEEARSQIEFAPIGAHHGGFIVYPELIYSLNYDDNILATSSNKESSYVSQLIPSVSARSNWNNHALNFNASSTMVKNHDFSSEDVIDLTLSTDGKLDISRNKKLFSGITLSRKHISRTTPNDFRGIEPTQFNSYRIFTRYQQQSGRYINTVNLSVTEKKFRDVLAIRQNLPVLISTSDRDRTEVELNYRAGYQYIRNDQIYLSVRHFFKDYNKIQSATGFDLNSGGLEISAGASFEYNDLISGDLSLGYRKQNYKEPLVDIHSPVFHAALNWEVTHLTTTNLVIDRTIQEAIDSSFSGYTATSLALGLVHEYQKNLLFNLSLQFGNERYSARNANNRTDKTFNLSAGSSYKVNQNLIFMVRYDRSNRESEINASSISSTNFDFDKNLISFLLQLQY